MRERLIALLSQVQDYGQKTTYEEKSITVSMPRNADVADFLIANGVTVTDNNVGGKVVEQILKEWVELREKCEFYLEHGVVSDSGYQADYCAKCHNAVRSDELFVVINPNNRRIKTPFNFCPACGRKLGE